MWAGSGVCFLLRTCGIDSVLVGDHLCQEVIFRESCAEGSFRELGTNMYKHDPLQSRQDDFQKPPEGVKARLPELGTDLVAACGKMLLTLFAVDSESCRQWRVTATSPGHMLPLALRKVRI